MAEDVYQIEEYQNKLLPEVRRKFEILKIGLMKKNILKQNLAAAFEKLEKLLVKEMQMTKRNYNEDL